MSTEPLLHDTAHFLPKDLSDQQVSRQVFGPLQQFPRRVAWRWLFGVGVGVVLLLVYLGSVAVLLAKGVGMWGNNQPVQWGFAEYSRVPAEHLALIPEGLDWPSAAGVPLAGHTAWQALVEHGQVEQGQKVLIHGGTGGVGHFAVQFAKVKGAEVYATASTDSLPFLRELGVDRAIDYKTERFEDICKDFDLVIDLIGGNTQARSGQVLGEGGRLVSTLTMPDAHHPQAAGKTGTRFTAEPRGEN
ncbi:NADP-dependent oxidoreductase [Pseudomonas versuta]|uniref:NADP-dependent oxidoreductase n=1 Tax=Pseudomonas versuta TaxID=1788301 RepID=UPI000AFC82EC|nr:NADP-dependent oxidoreductase [Pseudomonas versuta]